MTTSVTVKSTKPPIKLVSERSGILAGGNWIIDRVNGVGAGVETPIGIAPAPGALFLDGLDLSEEQLTELFAVDPDRWLSECILTEEYFGQFAAAVPAAMYAQLEVLREHLEAAKA